MKTAKEVFDEKYEYYRNMENKPPIPLEARELIFQAMEQYHESRMKDELMNFQKWYYENLYGLEMESSEEDIINNYLATRKNK